MWKSTFYGLNLFKNSHCVWSSRFHTIKFIFGIKAHYTHSFKLAVNGKSWIWNTLLFIIAFQPANQLFSFFLCWMLSKIRITSMHSVEFRFQKAVKPEINRIHCQISLRMESATLTRQSESKDIISGSSCAAVRIILLADFPLPILRWSFMHKSRDDFCCVPFSLSNCCDYELCLIIQYIPRDEPSLRDFTYFLKKKEKYLFYHFCKKIKIIFN